MHTTSVPLGVLFYDVNIDFHLKLLEVEMWCLSLREI